MCLLVHCAAKIQKIQSLTILKFRQKPERLKQEGSSVNEAKETQISLQNPNLNNKRNPSGRLKEGGWVVVWRRVQLYSRSRRRSRRSRRRRRRKRIIHLYSADRGTGAAAVVATFSNEPHFPTDTKRKLATNT